MSCSNCYNGCTDIVSDKCVRYTGIDVPVLGIQTGDSLSYVEQSLIGFLTSTLDGTGIKPTIDPTIICTLVQTYLPTCGDLTLVDLINALIQATCDLQEQIIVVAEDVLSVQNQVNIIEGPYTIGCLTGVGINSGTHAILQAVITKLCAFILDVQTNYVQLADLDPLIQAYLDSLPASNKYYTRMVPYTAVEFHADPGVNFSGTGVGLGDWEKIYLCNGLNGTPDKRGRVGVGVTFGTGMDAAVAPGGYNPLYNLSTKAGANSVALALSQIAAHSHVGSTATTVISPNPHTHTTGFGNPIDANQTGSSNTWVQIGSSVNYTSSAVTLVANTTPTIASEGGGLPHANNQPAIACYYIMYIP